MIARTIAATARTTPKIWFLGHVCLLAPGAARPDLSKSNRERCVSSVTRCSDEIGQRWQPAVPSSFHFNCRLFWRTGDAVAGLIGARLKTLSASRGKRDGKGPLALRQPLPVQRVRLGRRIDVATGSFRTPVHPADGRRCRPNPNARREATGRVSSASIAALAAGAAKELGAAPLVLCHGPRRSALSAIPSMRNTYHGSLTHRIPCYLFESVP